MIGALAARNNLRVKNARQPVKRKDVKCLGLVPSLLFPGERRAFPIRISIWQAVEVVRNSRASNMRYLVLRFGRVKPIIVCIT